MWQLLASASTGSNTGRVPEQPPRCIICELHLGDISSFLASSCKKIIIIDTKFSVSRYGNHWLASGTTRFPAYCSPIISPSKSRGWMRVAYVSASQGCPSGLEPVTAGGKKMCCRLVNTGCSSVTFPTHGVSYSKVCGCAYRYNKGSTDAFYRYNY